MITGCATGQMRLWRPGRGADNGGYPISLATFTVPMHVQQARAAKQRLQDVAGWKHVFVVDKGYRSELYVGRYKSRTAAVSNLERNIRGFRDAHGGTPYATALVVAIPTKDVGPPEWDLRNAAGAYTVVVQEYCDVPEKNYVGRKKLAVQYCRKFRERGYEAYYYHGPARSKVTVGVFEEWAVRTVRDGLMVREEIQDPRMKAVMREHPELLINGLSIRETGIDPQTRRLRYRRRGSYYERIPRKEVIDVVPFTDNRGSYGQSW